MSDVDQLIAAVKALQNEVKGLEAAHVKLGNECEADRTELRDARNRIRTMTDLLASGTPVVPGQGGGRRVLPNLTFEGKESDDWLTFKDSFSNVAKFQRYTGEEIEWALKSCMKGTAALSVMNINHEDQNMPFAALLTQYEEKFMPPAASDLARARFDEARQNTKEDILQFHNRLRTLWARAYPAEADPNRDLVIRKFMMGLRHSRIRDQVQRRRPQTFDAALGAAQDENAVIQGGKTAAVGDGSEPMEINKLDLTKTKCHFCQKMGHIMANCRQKKKEGRGPPTKEAAKNNPANKNKPKTWKQPDKRKQFRKLLQEMIEAGDDSEGSEDEDPGETEMIQEMGDVDLDEEPVEETTILDF